MADGLVAYNPSDTWQRQFLASLREGESGGDYSIGYGGSNLSGKSVDQYGFPQWSGKIGPDGISHAAGAYQFQPGTWQRVASKYNLDFRNKADQDAGAWYLAQEDYQTRTGRNLESDLKGGLYSRVASGLKSTWTSLTTSGLTQGMSAELSEGPSNGTWPSLGEWASDPVGSAGQVAGSYFIRGAMVLAGIVILGIALWALLSHYGAVPQAIALDT